MAGSGGGNEGKSAASGKVKGKTAVSGKAAGRASAGKATLKAAAAMGAQGAVAASTCARAPGVMALQAVSVGGSTWRRPREVCDIKVSSLQWSTWISAAPLGKAHVKGIFGRAVRILLLALHCFHTFSRCSQSLMYFSASPVWEDYTGEQLMGEICRARNSSDPRGTFKVDKIVWPPAICCPGGYNKMILAVVNVATIVVLLADDFVQDRAMGLLYIVADCAGGFLEHLHWMGGTFNERLSTTALLWPYLSLALVGFCFRPAGSGMPGHTLIRLLAALVVGMLLRVALFWALGVEPTTRGRTSLPALGHPEL